MRAVPGLISASSIGFKRWVIGMLSKGRPGDYDNMNCFTELQFQIKPEREETLLPSECCSTLYKRVILRPTSCFT